MEEEKGCAEGGDADTAVVSEQLLNAPLDRTQKRELFLRVDYRETALIEALESHVPSCKGALQRVRLDVADVQFVSRSRNAEIHAVRDDEHEGEEGGEGRDGCAPEKVMVDFAIERKTVSDMCASIKDGRAREQKARMRDCVVLREGGRAGFIVEQFPSFSSVKSTARQHQLQETALQSTMFNTLFRDGMFLFTTRDVKDTALCVGCLWEWYLKNAIYLRRPSEEEDAIQHVRCGGGESSVLLYAKKNKNITADTCFAMQLCQIPGVSHKTATLLADRWKSMARFYAQMAPLSDDQRLKELCSLRGVGKTSAANIMRFMFVDDGQTSLTDDAAV